MTMRLNLAFLFYVSGLTVFLASSQAEAKPAKSSHRVMLESNGEGVSLDIGYRRSLDEGNRASLRALASLVRRYPKGLIYMVTWRVRVGKKALNRVVTLYSREEQMVGRAARIIKGKGIPLKRLQYDQVAPDDLTSVAKRGGGFRQLEDVTNNVHLEYWR